MKKHLIIGASAAGINAAKQIRKIDKTAEIKILSRDEKIISRCMLHHVISGRKTADEISFVDRDFFERNNIQWTKGAVVMDIAFDRKKVILSGGGEEPYDSLLIASGARSFIPPIKGISNARNVYGLRDLEDVEEISRKAEDARSVMIIGAGLVGMDAASALLEKKLKVTLVEMADRLLPLQLDSHTAGRYQNLFEQAGAEIYTGVSVCKISTNPRTGENRIILSNNRNLVCDMIILATGVRANLGFIRDNTLETGKGITVNSKMETSLPDVYAAGDVTGLSAIWPVAVKQGIVAGSNMAGEEKEVGDFFTEKNSINFFGLTTVSLGLIHPPDLTFHVNQFNVNGVYRKIIHKDSTIYGTIIQNDISRCGLWASLIKNKIKVNLDRYAPYEQSYADYYAIDPEGNYKIENRSFITD